ncbi:MAG TPA: endolytic transglycosylase MltG [Solirubrobacterales bacterium]|nr:endolytic transglycosylase MltG [Solirubrobacterales bacterium]
MTTEDWLAEDPFAEGADPAGAERERRRREREERRHGGGGAAEAFDPVVEAAAPPPAARGSRRRGALLAPAAIVALLVLAVVAALAYRHFHRSAPPPAPSVKTVTVTIPEGYDRAQAAQLVREDGLRGSYVKASGGHEGFLFPDTFYLRRHAPARELVRLQLEDFKKRIKGVDMRYAHSKNLTTHDVVTIASMIEREAAVPGDRRLVAAVIYNRLHEGMPLGIDATIRFATGNYTKPLTESQLAVESPYNTRTHAGLPPGPIDSPGLASIEAAAHPARVGYLYYVVKPGGCGKLAFSSTEAQFEQDVARYRASGGEEGGGAGAGCGR